MSGGKVSLFVAAKRQFRRMIDNLTFQKSKPMISSRTRLRATVILTRHFLRALSCTRVLGLTMTKKEGSQPHSMSVALLRTILFGFRTPGRDCIGPVNILPFEVLS